MSTIGRMSTDSNAIIRRTRWRLLTPLLALLYLSTSDRANISFAALQMNAELGLDAGRFSACIAADQCRG